MVRHDEIFPHAGPPRLRHQGGLRRLFLNAAATPPMQEGSRHSPIPVEFLKKEGRRVSAGVVIKDAKPPHNAAKPPLFNAVRFANILKGGLRRGFAQKVVEVDIPLLYKEGRRVSAGVVIKVAKPQYNAAKHPLFNHQGFALSGSRWAAVRFAIIYRVASRLYKPPRSLCELPLLGKEGNVHHNGFLVNRNKYIKQCTT